MVCSASHEYTHLTNTAQQDKKFSKMAGKQSMSQESAASARDSNMKNKKLLPDSAQIKLTNQHLHAKSKQAEGQSMQRDIESARKLIKVGSQKTKQQDLTTASKSDMQLKESAASTASNDPDKLRQSIPAQSALS